jgi:phage-related protein
MMKSSWANLVTGLADENANLGVLVDNVIQSAFTVVDNILPRIEQALPSVATAITTAIPPLIQKISEVIDTALPTIIESAISIIDTLIQAISDNKDMLVSSAITIIMQLANGILNMLPEIIQLGLDLIVSLANGIAESLPELIPTIVDVVLQIVDTLTDPKQLSNLLDAALVLLTELAYGLMDAIPQLVDACVSVIEGLVSFLLNPSNIGKLISAAIQIVLAIATGLVNAIPQLLSSAVELIGSLVDSFKETDWRQIGIDIVNGIWNGLQSMWESLKSWFISEWDGLVGDVKDLLGIHSPSRVFAGIGKNMALGVGEGWDKSYSSIKRDIEAGMRFKTATVDFASSGVGISTAGIINASAGTNDGFSFPSSVELRLSSSDGQSLGRWIVPFVRSENKSNPEVVSDT